MNEPLTLFDFGQQYPLISSKAPACLTRDALVLRPQRHQAYLPQLAFTLDQLVPADHPVRAIWAVVAALDLSAWEAKIACNRRQGGRPAIDVRILLALWVFATTKGEGRASELARLCVEHIAYAWICGGVPVGEHTLADFRTAHESELDGLLTQTIAVFIAEDLVDVSRTAQDGTRVRASAGTGSFRRLRSLEQALVEARTHLEQVKSAARDPKHSEVRRAAIERGAEGRVERVEAAIERVRTIVTEKKLTEDEVTVKKGAPRVSTTDPEATIMKMGDGGFRPAYNVQFSTATDASGVVVGVEVTTRGTDQGETSPMLAQMAERTGSYPNEHLVDAGYVSHDSVAEAADVGTEVYAPLPHNLAEAGSPRYEQYETPTVEWIDRMHSDEGKQKYRLRGEVAELTNARAKSRYGLSMLSVRGLVAVTCCALLVGITANIERLISVRAHASEQAPDTPASIAAATPA
jgi:transposase